MTDDTPNSARDGRIAGGLFAAALLYATVRYNLFKGVPWADWPGYTLNKALAVAALLLITASVVRMVRPGGRSGLFMACAGVLALAHSLLSFALFTPLYYPRLFDGGKLTALAGLSITLGALAMAVMELGARRGTLWSPAVRHSTLALTAFATGLHAAVPAVSTWLTPATWPGGMPPLTLISFLTGLLACLALLRRRGAVI